MTDNTENLEGIPSQVIAKREEFAKESGCWRPCACYANPQSIDCMARALAAVAEAKQRASYPFASIEVGETFEGKKNSVAALCTRYNKKLAPKKFCTETKDGKTRVKRVA